MRARRTWPAVAGFLGGYRLMLPSLTPRIIPVLIALRLRSAKRGQ